MREGKKLAGMGDFLTFLPKPGWGRFCHGLTLSDNPAGGKGKMGWSLRKAPWAVMPAHSGWPIVTYMDPATATGTQSSQLGTAHTYWVYGIMLPGGWQCRWWEQSLSFLPAPPHHSPKYLSLISPFPPSFLTSNTHTHTHTHTHTPRHCFRPSTIFPQYNFHQSLPCLELEGIPWCFNKDALLLL